MSAPAAPQPAPPAPPGLPRLPWHARLDAAGVSLLVLLLAVVLSGPVLEGSDRELDHLANLARFAGSFFPPDFSIAGTAVAALGESVQIAVMATFFAIFLSVVVGLAATRTLSPRPLVLAARMALNGIRTIPSLIWALLAVAVVGANPLAGVIALTFYSVGYLGKFFSDAFESLDLEVAWGLRALGAGRIQAFQHGLWPSARPLVWSHSLWMLEYNIRSASIIGYVGAGGIGAQLHAYQEYAAWDRFAAVLLIILALVTALDFLGEWLRGKITGRRS